jgi:adenylate kinase family enzyme
MSRGCARTIGPRIVVLVGGPGAGKTHLATAIGVQAIEHLPEFNDSATPLPAIATPATLRGEGLPA